MGITRNQLAIMICLFLMFGLLHGQELNSTVILNEPVHKGDSVAIQIGDFYGDIQWQKTINLTDWLELPGENHQDLLLIADFSTYFRAKVTAGICEPIYSDTILIAVTEFGTVSDIDGNSYKTVKIGEQWWMAENLKTTKYSNGDSIRTTYPDTLSISLESTPVYQWAYPGGEDNVATYGRLYTWYAATNSSGVCPTGWHVPADTEWTTLTDYLGGGSQAGGKLKETGTDYWYSPNFGATNDRDFAALPGGYRYYNGLFELKCYYGEWWSSTENLTNDAWNRDLGYNYTRVFRYNMNKKVGLSVRCVKD